MNGLLIIDCGHSRTKFHSYLEGEVEHRAIQNTPFNWPKSIEPSNYRECLVMGTNDRMTMRWMSHWRQIDGVAPMVLGKDCRVPIEKQCGSGTGNDRMVHALGVKEKYPNEKVLVVSAGSALVIDIVENGVLKGGLIGLGWGRYQETMKGLNSNLITIDEPVAYPGLETNQAVSLGWKLMVESTINKLLEKENISSLVLTGGDAEMLREKWPNADCDPQLGVNALAHALGYTQKD